MEPVGKSCSLLIILTTLLSETWCAPDKELLCGGKILKVARGWHLVTQVGASMQGMQSFKRDEVVS